MEDDTGRDCSVDLDVVGVIEEVAEEDVMGCSVDLDVVEIIEDVTVEDESVIGC